ncbi:MAG TPA: CaiB/BaiF CoA-transferase family protein [bacterium]|nr:CaiB/BaiF CoA-transferase family protein [bacterium]
MAGPLEGIRVLDLSRLLPGPFCTMMMADMGAEVVKVEDPVMGDYVRNLPPYIDGTGVRYLALNRGKKSVALNLKDARGRDIFLELIKSFDVVVEGFRPGVMDRLGIGYETARVINPKIIYCSLAGYGQTGPYADRAGHDLNYIALTGVLDMTGPRGGRPVPPGIQAGDIGGAMSALAGVLAALVRSVRTGAGAHVDVSLADSAFAMAALSVAEFEGGETNQGRGETVLTGGSPTYNTYETKDGRYVCIGAIEPKFFKRFCELVGREDLEPLHFASGKDRDRLEAELERLFKTRTRDEWSGLLEAEDVCVSPVKNLREAMEDPHVLARGLLMDVPTGTGGTMKQTGAGFKFSGEPAGVPCAPPAYGEHTELILCEAGVGPEEIEELRSGGVIR